jgi:hypothetical protein
MLTTNALFGLLLQLVTTTPAVQNPRVPVTITEVEILVRNGTRDVWLSVDPGFANPIFLETRAREVYELGLGHKVAPLKKITLADLTKTKGTFFQVTADSSAVATASYTYHGAIGNIVLRTRDGDWLELEDVQSGGMVRVYYEDRTKKNGPTNFMKLPILYVGAGHFADVVFWSTTHRDVYRKGMPKANLAVNELRYANFKGIYPRDTYPDDDGGFWYGVPYMPEESARKGKYHSETAELCYHFESCQWSCITQ